MREALLPASNGMNNSISRYAIVFGIVVLIIIIGYSYQNRTSQNLPPSETEKIATTSANTINVGTTSSPIVSAVRAPKLERAVPENTSNLDAAYRTQIITYLEKTISALKKDEHSYQDWIYLGLYRKILGDYDGAYEAWNYATLLAPGEEVAYLNLANLYDLSLGNYAQAELYYKKGLEINPKNTQTYQNLFEMYRYRYGKNPSAAEDILKLGIAKNPEALDLFVLLARFYDEVDRAADARAEYDLAIELARKQGNASAATELEKEKSAVR